MNGFTDGLRAAARIDASVVLYERDEPVAAPGEFASLKSGPVDGSETPRQPCHTLTMAKHPKRPRDPNQPAKLVVDLATVDDSERSAIVQRGGKAKVTKSKAKSYIPGKSGSEAD